MLIYCWATVCDAGPTINQHWVKVLCFFWDYTARAAGKCRRWTVATVPHKNHNYRHISNIRSYVQLRRVADDSATLQSGRYDFYHIRWRYCQLISHKSILYGSQTAECISCGILSKPVRSEVWHYIIYVYCLFSQQIVEWQLLNTCTDSLELSQNATIIV